MIMIMITEAWTRQDVASVLHRLVEVYHLPPVPCGIYIYIYIYIHIYIYIYTHIYIYIERER